MNDSAPSPPPLSAFDPTIFLDLDSERFVGKPPDSDPPDWHNLTLHYESVCSEERKHALASQLGLPNEVLYALGIGWCYDDLAGGCFTFPESDGLGRIIGITRRYAGDRQQIWPGSQRGLTMPDEWEFFNGPAFVAAGATDTLALSGMKLSALGQPGPGQGIDYLAARLKVIDADRPIIVIAKTDPSDGDVYPNRDGARRTAAELTMRLGRAVKWASTPNGAEDIRAGTQILQPPPADEKQWQLLSKHFVTCLRPRTAPGPEVLGTTAEALLKLDLREPRWVIGGLLPEGATILAGKPKGGKSWLALQLALAVAGGGLALGQAQALQGEALYLALEDTSRRLKNRLKRLLGQGEGTRARRLRLMTEWRPLASGGLDDLAAWLSAHQQARLLVLDTLAMLRSSQGEGGYLDEYAAMTQLRTLAAGSGVAVLIIHHVRKRASQDPFDSVSGTMGLTGAADSVWVLERQRHQCDAVLHITGRDVDEQELALRWDGASGRWSHLGPAQAYRLAREEARVLDVLTRAGMPLRIKEIALRVDKREGTTRTLLWRMAEKGLVVSEDGSYAPVRRDKGVS